ncbi:MAG TPA: YeeE/YedE family protein [Usitatibacteraceae bacterium]
MKLLSALLIGALFGAGLLLSGMSNAGNVLNFLDLAGSWDPRLLFVMGGAVVVTGLAYPWLMRRARPRLAEKFHWPTAKEIDARLLIGAALFGVGWGLAGYCPGPALANIGMLSPAMLVFIPAMLAGMWLALQFRAHKTGSK